MLDETEISAARTRSKTSFFPLGLTIHKALGRGRKVQFDAKTRMIAHSSHAALADRAYDAQDRAVALANRRAFGPSRTGSPLHTHQRTEGAPHERAPSHIQVQHTAIVKPRRGALYHAFEVYVD